MLQIKLKNIMKTFPHVINKIVSSQSKIIFLVRIEFSKENLKVVSVANINPVKNPRMLIDINSHFNDVSSILLVRL